MSEVQVKEPTVMPLDLTGGAPTITTEAVVPSPRKPQVLPVEDTRPVRPSVGQTQWSEQVDQLIGALAVAQTQFSEIEKNKRAIIKGKANYSYKYADLFAVMESIRKPLAEQGLVVIQFPKFQDRSVVLETVCFHKSGQWIKNTITMPLMVASPQDIGIVLAYARRYGVSALFALAAGETDNDGQVRGGQLAEDEDEPAFIKLVGVRETSTGGAWIVRAENGHEYVTDDEAMAGVCERACKSGVLVDMQWEARTGKTGAKYRHMIEVAAKE